APGLVSASTPVGRLGESQSPAASALARSCGSVVPRWVLSGVQVSVPRFSSSTQAGAVCPEVSDDGIEAPLSLATNAPVVPPDGGGGGGGRVAPLGKPPAGEALIFEPVIGPY